MAIEIDLKDFSNGTINRANPDNPVWAGTGVFDELIKAINGNIQIQFEAGRIQNAEYAEVYLGSVQTAITEAMKFVLQNGTLDKEIELKQAQIAKINAERDLVNAQLAILGEQQAKDLLVKQANIDLLNRQKEGFDDNKYQKLFEAQMNAWALMFSSGLLTTKPEIISNDSASSLYNTLKPK